LTVEAIILQDRFRTLFTNDELIVAEERLGDYAKTLKAIISKPPGLYPDELPPGRQYVEGARKLVRVNAYERNPKARVACLAEHGYNCSVCGMSFVTMYGALGKDFIHVHHLRPLALSDGGYKIDAVADLRPVNTPIPAS
jgi:5-methylcytosine-specific restriction enzyme A